MMHIVITARWHRSLATRLLLSTATAEPLPVPKQGNRQPPTGYIGSGDYFVPSGTKCQAIPKTGSKCPWGWLSSGNYCVETGDCARGLPRR